MYRETKNEDVRVDILAGVKEVADIVGKTLGPKGRNIVLDLQPFDSPIITNDGVTIVREFNSKDKWKNIGIKLVREVAGRTNDEAGDGTTTATLLFYEICKEVQKALQNEADSLALRRGIEMASKAIVEQVKSQAKQTDKLDDLVKIATISCGDVELGKTVASLVKDLGKDALIALEDSVDTETVAEKTEGLRLKGGVQAPQVFITNPAQQQVVADNVPILVTNMALSAEEEMVRIMEVVAGSGKKEAIVISERIDNQALYTAVVNKLKGNITIIPIRVMAYGPIAEGYLEDIARVTGGTYFSTETGYKLNELTINNFGTASKVIATKDQTTIIDGAGDKNERVKELEGQLANDTSGDYQAESLRERIAKLKSELGVIKVGGTTEVERKERKLRVEDAICAAKAALSEGIVTGGASALFRAISNATAPESITKYENDGWNAVEIACVSLLYQLTVNSSVEVTKNEINKLVKNNNLAIDFNTGEIVDAYKTGIVDPVKVIVSALQNAAAQAAIFVTTEGGLIVSDDPKPEQQ